MSRRVLITLWPFTGHLLPQLSIANALRERGHEVAFYTGEDARGTIDQEGFELFRSSASLRSASFEAGARSTPAISEPVPAAAGCSRSCATGSMIPDQVADLRAVLAPCST